MKRERILKTPFFTKEQIEAAIAAAPDYVDDPESPYDPNNAAEVRAFWSKAERVLPGSHRFQHKKDLPSR